MWLLDVVVVAHGAGHGAAGEGTADVAEQDGFSAGCGEGAGGAADVEDFGFPRRTAGMAAASQASMRAVVMLRVSP